MHNLKNTKKIIDEVKSSVKNFKMHTNRYKLNQQTTNLILKSFEEIVA